MAKKRLIDANSLYDKLEQKYKVSSWIVHSCYREFLDMICDADIADSVEVVRCKVREILFRGKRDDNGKWVQGCYLFDGYDHTINSFSEDETSEGCLYFAPEVYGVLPETIGQYTGLKDKHGEEIFEGDIVVLHGRDLPMWRSNGEKVVVKYARFGFEPFCGYMIDPAISIDDYECKLIGINADECEVIGNIYDNPELAEVN